jgi:hypothetical protein
MLNDAREVTFTGRVVSVGDQTLKLVDCEWVR